jgi:hypothetical protein
MATAQAVANSVVGAVTTPAPVEVKKEESKVFVTIPEKTVLGWIHPGVGINLQHYGPGTHQVSEAVANEINERLKAHHIGQLQLLEPKVGELVRKKLYDMV